VFCKKLRYKKHDLRTKRFIVFINSFVQRQWNSLLIQDQFKHFTTSDSLPETPYFWWILPTFFARQKCLNSNVFLPKEVKILDFNMILRKMWNCFLRVGRHKRLRQDASPFACLSSKAPKNIKCIFVLGHSAKYASSGS